MAWCDGRGGMSFRFPKAVPQAERAINNSVPWPSLSAGQSCWCPTQQQWYSWNLHTIRIACERVFFEAVCSIQPERRGSLVLECFMVPSPLLPPPLLSCPRLSSPLPASPLLSSSHLVLPSLPILPPWMIAGRYLSSPSVCSG